MEEGEASPRGGRKPVKLEINKSFGVIAGIEIHPNYYQAALINLEGDVLSTVFKNTAIYEQNILEHYSTIINDLLNEIKDCPPLLGVGIGITGIVDSSTGTILQSIPLNVENLQLQAILEKQGNIPISVENDANACCWGEMVFHRGNSLKNFLFVLVKFHGAGMSDESTHGIAVGIGFVFNGKIHYGQNHSAGEFKSIDWSNKYSSQFSIKDKDTYRVEENYEVFDKFALELSSHLAFLVNTLNLNHIFLGGDIEKHKDRFSPILEHSIQKNWPYKEVEKCTIHYSSFGKSAVSYGAAGMMLNRLFVNKELIYSLYGEKGNL